MYCGHFDSIIGSNDNFIKNANCSNNPNLTIKSSINRDQVSSICGENILDLCKNRGLRICNGRLGEACDKGNYTFYCTQSTEPYILYLILKLGRNTSNPILDTILLHFKYARILQMKTQNHLKNGYGRGP